MNLGLAFNSSSFAGMATRNVGNVLSGNCEFSGT